MYKIVIIISFLTRAHENLYSHPLFLKQINNVKQPLIKNNNTYYFTDHEITLFLSNSNVEHTDKKNTINISHKRNKCMLIIKKTIFSLRNEIHNTSRPIQEDQTMYVTPIY